MNPISPTGQEQTVQLQLPSSNSLLSLAFKGRITRKQFILGLLLSCILVFICLGAIAFSAIFLRTNFSPIVLTIIYIILILVLNVWYFSLFVRRFHDLGHSGLWTLLTFIPGVVVFIILFLIFKKGQDINTPQINLTQTIVTKYESLIIWVIILLSSLIFSIGIYQSSLQQKNQQKTLSPVIPPEGKANVNPLPNSTEASAASNVSTETANWKTYVNNKLKISFKYPQDYVVSEDSNLISFRGHNQTFSNDDSKPYLVISTENLYDPTALSSCDEIVQKKIPPKFPCIGNSFLQKEKISGTKLGEVDAISFYISENLDLDLTKKEDYHIIQTTKGEILQFKMLNSGYSLDKDFNNILSTFKFIQSQ